MCDRKISSRKICGYCALVLATIVLSGQLYADAPAPRFSLAGGFYYDGISLTLSTVSQVSDIFFTLDGSEPSEAATRYEGPIAIATTTVVRARSILPDLSPSPTITHTYFIDEDYALAVISLVSDPSNLWDKELGIYVVGQDSESPNYDRDWERPVHLEFFEADSRAGFRMDAGMKIHGGRSRQWPQKSLSLFARKKYGHGKIRYPLFPDRPIADFEAVILRNSGNDWNATMFRDALMTTLVRDTGTGIQAYRPVVVFLNGRYWGIQNLREKFNEHYLASHYGVDTREIDLLDGSPMAVVGDTEHYSRTKAFIAKQDLSIARNYDHIQTLIDADDFIEYQVAQIYFGNMDWPGDNIKYWRPKHAYGKWRWLLFDTDFGFARWDYNPFSFNTLEFATEPDGPEWPNPPWSTLFLRKLLENTDFRRDFIIRFATDLNTIFRPERVIDTINRMQAAIELDMPAHQELWGGSMEQWYGEVEVLVDFAANRANHVRRHIMAKFRLESTLDLGLEVTPPGAGEIVVDRRRVTDFPWHGEYFTGIPITLSAVSHRGYRFSGWLTDSETRLDSSVISLDPSGNVSATARFERANLPHTESVKLTEINYHSSDESDSADWLEIYNTGNSAVVLSGWKVVDEDPSRFFIFPSGTLLSAGQYLVITRDRPRFSEIHPQIRNIVGDFNFGLDNGGQLLRIYDEQGALRDSLTYDDDHPWPPEADGQGATLALIHPLLDNAIAGNWAASAGDGTPGKRNTDIVDAAKPSVAWNFPNPFDAGTTILFSMAEAGNVEIEIFNALGQMVHKISDVNSRPGYNAVALDGRGLANGVYFYRITTRTSTFVRRMLVLRQ